MGFFELVVIGVIALLVFGPEKLPKVLYDTAQLWRSVRRSATALRQEFEQTVSADIKADIHNSGVMKSLEENKIAVEQTLSSLEQPFNNPDLPYNLAPNNDEKQNSTLAPQTNDDTQQSVDNTIRNND